MTAEGKVYACGEATNGRLGLGLSSGTIPIPRQISALSNYVVKKVAVHSGMLFSVLRKAFCKNLFFEVDTLFVCRWKACHGIDCGWESVLLG